MEMQFEDVQALFRRLSPALKSKVYELHKMGYNYLEIEDVWNYLKEKKWQGSCGLSLNEMVSDIFCADNELIDDFFKEKINKKNRKLYFEG